MFKLQPGTSTDGVVYSVALPNTETLETAHLRENVLYLDALQNGDALPIDTADPIIRPSPQLSELMQQTVATVSSVAGPAPMRAAVTTKRKPTTAKNFFAAPKKNKTEEEKENLQKKKKKKKDAPSKKKTDPPPTKPPSKQPPGWCSAKSTKPQKSSSSSKRIGNADDFVGDLEESSDEEILDEAVTVRSKTKPDPESMMLVDDSDDEAKMDDTMETEPTDPKKSAAKPTSEKPTEAQPAKRRVKKLVDKTTVDSNGYLTTEKVEEWVEIDIDEPAASLTKPLPKKKPAVKKKKQKQGTLTGFFKKS